MFLVLRFGIEFELLVLTDSISLCFRFIFFHLFTLQSVFVLFAA